MPKYTSLERQLLDLVRQPDYKPAKPRVIAKQLKLADDDLRRLKRCIKRLVRSGELAWGPKHLVLKAAGGENKNEVIGRFHRASGGYGFVAPRVDDAASDAPPVDDIYVAERRTLDAATGDVVRVRVSTQNRGNRLRTSGRIVEVIERRSYRFVGTYHERSRYGLVAVDGNEFDTDILVGDAGAKNCRIGDKVVVEMVRFPSTIADGEGVIVEVLGARGQPGVDTLTIIHQYGLPQEFSDAVLEDARRQAKKFDDSNADGRVDFTDQTVVTIDPKEARDFDDAISLTRTDNEHWRLGVHIADVSHFVQPNTELDNEAYRRGTSVYLPDRVIPMLPETISNNLASLQPDRLRYTMTAVIEFTDDGVPVTTEMHRGAIKSAHRFNYEEIDEYLENPQPWKRKLSKPVFDLVGNMHVLAMKLRKRRMGRGAFDLIIPEIKIDLDEDGRVCGAHTREHTESHQIIEEFMLAANEAVAQYLQDLELPFVRRIHEAPSATKLADLKVLLRDLGFPSDNIQSRFEMKRIIAEASQRPERNAVHFAILRAMQKAIYGPREIGHYALASQAYCHFTSPIRRYPDLVIHRMIGALIDGNRPAAEFGLLQRIGQHCSELEQRAEQAERELVKLKLINYLSDRIGMELDAVITGVEAFGVFAQGTDLPVNGFLPLDSLPQDHYYFDRRTRTIEGHKAGNSYRLGNPIRVRVVIADPDRREIEFALANKRGKAQPKTRRKQSANPSKTVAVGKPKKHK